MELRQLVYFEAVVRCGGFTRAAEDLRVAQPAISAQIRRLEGELGVALLARTSRRVDLTEAGGLFLTRARRVLAEIGAARDDMAEVATVVRGRVVVGATSVLGGFDLPSALARFAGRYPGVTLSVRTGLVAELLDELADGRLDLVLGPVHSDRPRSCVAVPLADDRLVLISPPGRFARGATVELADLADAAFVCLPVGSGLRDVLTTAARTVGFDPQLRFEAPTVDGVRDMVAAGLGVAVIAASAVERPGPPVDVHDVRPVPPHPPFGVLRRDDRPLSPAAAALYEHLLRAAIQ